ncbi:MAG: hypothetical protein GTO18_21220 [Anaerolineales bacterium]|nr:hypothetical protein [Anaerolineales bacterium]
MNNLNFSISGEKPNKWRERLLLITSFVLMASLTMPSGNVRAEIIEPSRMVDWTEVGYPGEIPKVPVVVNVMDFGAKGDGITNDYAAITTAINSATSPGAVLFPEGTYRYESTIKLKDGIVLRGEWADKTHLECDLSGASRPCIEAVTYRRGDFTPAISGLEKGSTLLQVADASSFSPGDTAEIQQENDPTIMYTKPEWNQPWARDSVGQFFHVIAVNGNTLTIDPPLHLSFRTDLNAVVRTNGLISNVGIEKLHIKRLDAGDGHTIHFKNSMDSWVRLVHSEYTYRTHVSVTSSINVEVRDSYFHHAHDYGGGGHGYGVNVNTHSTNCLVENNIFEHLRHSMMLATGANGNVFGYNYSFDTFANGGWDPPDISVHGHYPFMNLFEGNIVQEAWSTDYWGPAGPGITLFRNRIEFENLNINDHSHNQNVIGNELTEGSNRIWISNDSSGTLVHGNNVNGQISWDPAIPDHDLPNSYYLISKPAFFGSLPWPSIGSEFTLGEGTIPAKDRYESGQPIPIEESETTFADVPRDHWAYDAIEALYQGGYIAGCSAEPRLFCPENEMTRAEGSVFVERGIHGAGYMPTEPNHQTFADVPTFEWFFKWAEGLWEDGYTAGCGIDPLIFCPLQGHTRAEAAVFFERMLHGADFVPADPVTQFYDDVPVGGSALWFSKWIMAAYQDGLVQDCEDVTNRGDAFYRPYDDITRSEAACMMAKARSLH